MIRIQLGHYPGKPAISIALGEKGLWIASKGENGENYSWVGALGTETYVIGYMQDGDPSTFSTTPEEGLSPIFAGRPSLIWVDPRKIEHIEDPFDRTNLGTGLLKILQSS